MKLVKKYTIKRETKDLLKFMNTRADKIGLQCTIEENKILLESKPGEDSKTQTPIPVVFKGTVLPGEEITVVEGRFEYGFYLTTLVLVAAALIIARLLWSVYQKQMENIIMCGIGTVLLMIVILVAVKVGKPLKEKMEEFFLNLEK